MVTIYAVEQSEIVVWWVSVEEEDCVCKQGKFYMGIAFARNSSLLQQHTAASGVLLWWLQANTHGIFRLHWRSLNSGRRKYKGYGSTSTL